MRNFLTKIFFYVTFVIGICYALQYIIDDGLKNYDSEVFIEWNRIFQGRINSEIIILGSSRAKGHFNPKIIENEVGLSCYNLGIGAGKIFLEKARLQTLLKYNNSPRILIQNVDIFSTRPEKEIVFKEQFLPYLSESTIYPNLENIDKNIFWERILPLYKYRGYRKIVYKGVKSFFNLIGQSDLNDYYNGYISRREKWNADFERFKAKNTKAEFSWDEIKKGINYLEILIKNCKNKQLKIILVHSPMYIELQRMMPQKEYFDRMTAKLAKDNNIHLLDYSLDSLSYNRDYFYNALHLNDKGVELFTKKFADSLKSIIHAENWLQ